MRTIKLGLVLLAALVWCGAPPARAENPKVSLKLENVTAAEAIAALAKASKAALSLSGSGGRLAKKSSFDWQGVSLARAMRELCRRYQLRPNRDYRSGGYRFYPAQPALPAAAAPRVGLVEKQGVRIFPRSIGVTEDRGLRFEGRKALPDADRNLHAQIFAELGDLDPLAVVGLANLVAKDDRGNLLVSERDGGRTWGSTYRGSFPDEWMINIQLTGPHPQATKLEYLEADLMVYKSVRFITVEIKLPLEGKLARKQLGELEFFVSGYEIIPPQPAPMDDLIIPGLVAAQRPALSGPSMRVRVLSPVANNYTSRSGDYFMRPTLVGESGKRYPATSYRGGSGVSNGRISLRDSTWIFPGVKEKPAKLVWELVERLEPVKLFTFRMTDIPLPAPAPFVARKQAPKRTRPARATKREKYAFYQKGGGTLVSPVTILGKPARGGKLQIGLAPKRGEGFGAIRWADVEVDDQGVARLPDLKPGTYRLLRIYQPTDRKALGGKGRWLHGETQITLVAGKEATPPALAWTNAPPKPDPKKP